MQVIPAIDILGGKCTRLRQGDYDSAQIFHDNPASMAKQFCQLGAKRLHFVDLDAAKSGKRENAGPINDALAEASQFGVEVQIGGGLRSIKDVETILKSGASYAIVGTAAIRDAKFRSEVIASFPGQIILGADARNGQLAISGWQEQHGMHITELLDSVSSAPPAAVLFTDIACDGMLAGANVDATAKVASRAPCPVLASGGVRDENDIRALSAAHDNIAGAVVGRAVYENIDILKPLLSEYA